MSDVPALALSHIGVYVTDVAKMVDFYTRILGFTVTDRGSLGGNEVVFLSRDPRDHHQIVLASGRPQGSFNMVNQISLRCANIGDLRKVHAAVMAEGAKNIAPIDHGIAWSVYFHDPEGCRVEVFMDTPWYIYQPHRDPLDLSLSDEELYRVSEAKCRKSPTFKLMRDWRAEIAPKMGVAA